MAVTSIAWIILFAVLVWMSFTRHPIWGLGCYLFVLYASPAHHWYGQYVPNLRWSLIAALVTLASLQTNPGQVLSKRVWYSNGAAKILVIYSAWMWIQLPWALSFSVHLGATILFTKYCVLFYLIYKVVDTEIRFYQFIMFNILGGLYWGYLVKGYSVAGRVEHLGGPGINDSNTLGMHLSVILIFSGLIFIKRNNEYKKSIMFWASKGLVFIAAALIANGIVQTVSRSAVLGISVGGLALLFLNHKTYRKKLIMYAMVAIVGLLYLTPEMFWGRMDTIRTAVGTEPHEIESSAYTRLVVAKAQLEMFQANIMGHGHRGTAVLSPYYIPAEYLTETPGRPGHRARSSHCTFLTTLVEQGIPGAILYWMMVYWGIKTVLSFKKEDAEVYLYVMMMAASLSAIFISGIFVDYLKVEIQIFCLAMLASLKEYSKIKEEQQRA